MRSICDQFVSSTQLFSTQTSLVLSRDSHHERSWGGTRDKPKNVCVGGYHLRKIKCKHPPCFVVSSKKNMSERLGEWKWHWYTSHRWMFPQFSRSSPKSSLLFYNSIETRRTCFLFCWKKLREKGRNKLLFRLSKSKLSLLALSFRQ